MVPSGQKQPSTSSVLFSPGTLRSGTPEALGAGTLGALGARREAA